MADRDVGREVAAQHANERALKKAKSFLDALVDAIPTPVLVKDNQHRYIAANTAFTAFFRRQRSAILGKTDYDFFSTEDAGFYQATDREALSTGKVVEYEHAYSLDGITRWMMVRKCRLIRPFCLHLWMKQQPHTLIIMPQQSIHKLKRDSFHCDRRVRR